MRFAVEALDEQLGEMLASEIAVAEDVQFIRGDGTSNTPRGLKSFAAMANTNTGLNVIQSAGATLAEIIIDLQSAISALLQASVVMAKPTWIMSPGVAVYLKTLLSSDGHIVFSEMSHKRTFSVFRDGEYPDEFDGWRRREHD
jgi:HK97 family phage major capsid protein